jgi:hypothetical protein
MAKRLRFEPAGPFRRIAGGNPQPDCKLLLVAQQCSNYEGVVGSAGLLNSRRSAANSGPDPATYGHGYAIRNTRDRHSETDPVYGSPRLACGAVSSIYGADPCADPCAAINRLGHAQETVHRPPSRSALSRPPAQPLLPSTQMTSSSLRQRPLLAGDGRARTAGFGTLRDADAEGAQPQIVGLMFWFSRNRLVGSYLFFRATRRP